ncbi:hypothetical protein RRG08_064659 [Elysia crispata]|uniref:Uncharacterized protein n=1 Tax=Elysia crispata TaxID=231223 RepID=A0AAE1EC42_9GAST|nr:hypothetical protein RRG08_064659 [Elysia crispata]
MILYGVLVIPSQRVTARPITWPNLGTVIKERLGSRDTPDDIGRAPSLSFRGGLLVSRAPSIGRAEIPLGGQPLVDVCRVNPHVFACRKALSRFGFVCYLEDLYSASKGCYKLLEIIFDFDANASVKLRDCVSREKPEAMFSSALLLFQDKIGGARVGLFA